MLMDIVQFYGTKATLIEALNEALDEFGKYAFSIFSESWVVYGVLENTLDFQIQANGPFYALAMPAEQNAGIYHIAGETHGVSGPIFFERPVTEFAEAFGRFEDERMEAERWEEDENNPPPAVPLPPPGRIDSSTDSDTRAPRPKRRILLSDSSDNWLTSARNPLDTDTSEVPEKRARVQWDSEENLFYESTTDSDELCPRQMLPRNAGRRFENFAGLDTTDEEEEEDWSKAGTDYGSFEDEQEEEGEESGEDEDTDGEPEPQLAEQEVEYDGDDDEDQD